MKNPWLGLSSYTEESLKYYQFNGRNAAIASLAALIRRNLFVTLYGRSGIGKTSLLQAGVFPLLRREGFAPLSIRLNSLEEGVNASEVIWGRICETLQKEGYIYTLCDADDEYKPDFSDILVLRKLFSAGKFINGEGVEAIPVIAIDQFEEILYKNPEASSLLISQLYALIDDNYNLRVVHRNWHDYTNFRIVVSIREDDLFLFEDYIDSLNCVDFKSNRYRLLPLSDDEAKEVVLNPAANKNIFNPENEDVIADAIVKLSKNGGQNVNTLLLSLICYVLFNDNAGKLKPISLSDLDSYKDVLESYYKEIIKKIPKNERYWIEDHLIDDQGRRKSEYLSDLEKFAPHAKQLIGNSNQRLLNENQGRVEFIHDQLAESVAKIRSNRKSKKSKRIGVVALIILLLGMFLYSFSRPTDWSSLYPNSWNLMGDTKAESVKIKFDSIGPRPLYTYTIDDCPLLKSVDIKGEDGRVVIYNCPSLVNIRYSKEFNGDIYVYNCPNVRKFGTKIQEENISDTTLYNEYRSQYPKSSHPLGYHYNCDNYFINDSLRHSIVIKNNPVGSPFITREGENVIGIQRRTIPTGLPDSIKKITDCYVLYGQKDNYSRLVEYQPFKSINELPVYYTWKSNFEGMFSFLKHEQLWRNLCIMGILLIQCVFWITAFVDYRQKLKNALTLFCVSFFYGIGMSLLGVLSFMAFYWSTYEFILLGNQLISTIIGSIGCLVCMTFVYKNSFYLFYKYFKVHGVKGFLRDCKDGIKNTPEYAGQALKKCKDGINKTPQYTGQALKKMANSIQNAVKIIMKHYFISLTILLVIIGIICYSYGQNKRERYIELIGNMINDGEYARAYAIIEGLEHQKTIALYPSYRKNLLALKAGISGDSISLYHRITPQSVKALVGSDENLSKFSYFSQLLAVSNDATKFAICVKYPKSDDLERDSCQAILLDLNSQSVRALTPKSKDWFSGFKSTISPSGKTVITSVDSKRYLYHPKGNSYVEISDKYYGDVDDIIMSNDSVYYFISWGKLYKAFLGDSKGPIMINSSERIYGNLNLISDNLIGCTGNWSEIIIYHALEDSVYFHSNQRNIGKLRNIDQDHAITTEGLFSIKKDTLVYKNENLYEYKGEVVKLAKNNGQFSFVDLQGKQVQTIKTEKGDYLNDIRFSKDGNSIIDYTDWRIDIYNITSIAKRNWVLYEEDKKTFGLK